MRPCSDVVAAHELGDEQRRRLVIELLRGAGLDDAALLDQHDLVGDRHRLDLVVGHEHGGQPQPLDEPAHPDARFLPKLGVEVRQRLVEEDDRRAVGEGARERDALLLAARELMRKAGAERAEADPLQHLGDPRLDVGAGGAAHPKPIGDVVEHRLVRPQRVGLEHEAEVAALGRDVDAAPGVEDLRLADGDRAGGRRLEPGDAAQQRRLAAAGAAEKRRDPARPDGIADAAQDLVRPEADAQIVDRQRRRLRAAGGIIHRARSRAAARSRCRARSSPC